MLKLSFRILIKETRFYTLLKGLIIHNSSSDKLNSIRLVNFDVKKLGKGVQSNEMSKSVCLESGKDNLLMDALHSLMFCGLCLKMRTKIFRESLEMKTRERSIERAIFRNIKFFLTKPN